MVGWLGTKECSLADNCRHDVFTIATNLVKGDSENIIAKPAIQIITGIELKKLPAHLKYVFHDNDPRSPVIISSTLDTSQKERLVKTLQGHKGAIVWSITNIKGITLSFCTHKILMEDNVKRKIQPQ